MLLKKDNIVYYNEVGHNNICYPDKTRFIILQEDLECETIPLFNNEGMLAIKFNINKYPNLYWIKK